MNVASLEVCKELYELSGWDDEFDVLEYTQSGSYRIGGSIWPNNVYAYTKDDARKHHQDIHPHTPAYDLGYLLRKLPSTSITNYSGELKNGEHYESWTASAYEYSVVRDADNPEDAAAKLAIQLFELGILEKEN